MKDRLEAIKNESLIDWWANEECAQMKYDTENNSYYLVRSFYNGEKMNWVVPLSQRDTSNCPIIAKGIIAYVLHNYGKGEKDIFNSYYNRCLSAYIKKEEVKPGSSMRDLDSEFSDIHLRNERSQIDLSLKLSSFLSADEMAQLNQYARSYLSYIENDYTKNITTDVESQPQKESYSVKEKVKAAFAFMNGTCPRKMKIILNDSDFSKLIDWLTFYFENDLKIPEIEEPIKIINTNKTFVQLALRYFYKKLYPNAKFPDSLFELYRAAFYPYRMDKKSNFYSAKLNDEVEKLMKIY